MALTDKLTAIANAIRAKTGKTAKMTMTEMVTEIEGIQNLGDSIIDRSINEAYTSESVTKVGSYAFYGCLNLPAVSFTAALAIGDYAFYLCNKLATIDFPKVTSISPYAFRNCKTLTKVYFPEATEIGEAAFNYASSLATANFPKASSIGQNAFNGCRALTALVLDNTSAVCLLSQTNAFTNTPIKSGTGYIYVPDSLVDSYKAATNWSTYAAQIKPLSEYTGG